MFGKEAGGLYVLYTCTFSKEAEMMLLWKIGVFMVLLLFLLFVITGANIIRSSFRSSEVLLSDFSGSGSNRPIISALQKRQISKLFSLEPAVAAYCFNNLIFNLIGQNEGGMK